jgi:lysyl-tRNA synthetase, class II
MRSAHFLANMTDTTAPQPSQQSDENALMAERRAKLHAARKTGNAYPNDFRRDALAGDLQEKFGAASKEDLEGNPTTVKVAGRMMLRRVMGKASFAALQDMSGRVQIYVNDEGVSADTHEAFKHWDIGDIISAEGTMFKTNKGELSVKATNIRLLSKSLRPLPEKFHGMADVESRYRQRYLDLITNEESTKVFVTRSKLLQAIREFFVARRYLEVETPMMHPIPGGAAARPFKTHHNALDMELYMRIAPELYLKKLVVGGFERVFEINRNFRNEGMSVRHNPEFTMIEFYEAYQDHHYLMDLTEQLLRECAQKVAGATTLPYGEHRVDLGKPFDRLTMPQAVNKYHPSHTLVHLSDRNYLLEQLGKMHVKVKGAPLKDRALGELQLLMFEETTEALLIQPTFIVDYPWEISPLARKNDTNPEITDRFELFITGREMANGFSELNDPEDQASRFAQQADAKQAGDDEAMFFDADYIRALEHGLPPTAGEGIGIDRLVMLFTNSPSIRDVILFPQMRRVEE